jgi:hypothetical protein
MNRKRRLKRAIRNEVTRHKAQTKRAAAAK